MLSFGPLLGVYGCDTDDECMLNFKLYKTFSGGGPIHARVPIHAHPQFS